MPPLFNMAKKLVNPKIGNLLMRFIDAKFLDRESPFIPLWLFFMYGVRTKKIKENTYLVSGFGEKMLMQQGAWRVFLEIFYEDPYEQFFKVEEGDVVIDVGAHVGCFSIKAGRKTGKNGLVVAIEPEDTNFSFLSENVKLAGMNNIIILKKAIGEKRGKDKLYVSKGTGRAHSFIRKSADFIEVEIDTLDNVISELGLKKVNFVKIDVEGFELEVLKGADKLLSMPNVKFAIASYHKMADGSLEFPKIISYLKSKNLEIWTNKLGYIYAKTK